LAIVLKEVADFGQVILWHRPPEYPAMSVGEIHLWRVDLEMMRQLPGNFSLLSQSEKERFRRLVSLQKRDDFCAAHAALRMILAGYLNMLPRALKFGFSRSGKPFLVNRSIGKDLRFNLAHSGKWMLVGVCLGAELGVDIEEVRMVDYSWALNHIFSQGERAMIGNLDGGERASGFTRLWTLKEAAAKADGTGLAHYASQTQSAGLSAAMDEKNTISREGGFWMLNFEPAPGYWAALAARAKETPRIRYLAFEPTI
jgi:4'-phosphopantetheinyl transferase